MIRNLLYISLAPVAIIGLYVYIRDKYEKEPVICLLKALFIGVLLVLPIVLVESITGQFSNDFPAAARPFYNGFFVAALTEEGFKFGAFMLFIWKSRDFNEKFDGIVYAVYISLGFAAIENIFYVYKGGYDVGLLRALTAVPAHALFATVMGYHFANAKFYPEKRSRELFLAFLVPFAWHGLYDSLLMIKKEVFLLVFIPVFILYWFIAFKRMNELSAGSVFRNDLPLPEPDDGDDFQDIITG
ncbi:MAG TPA: PrsW family glutamic-type intramembrane protease [Bacteroidales bacterium]|nr:PrsW family glutamic-type intramembrane protease [Bacteroidales bacterium]